MCLHPVQAIESKDNIDEEQTHTYEIVNTVIFDF